jgi:hypothetical protein
MAMMLVALASTAPKWINSPQTSSYDAPWVYPGLQSGAK